MDPHRAATASRPGLLAGPLLALVGLLWLATACESQTTTPCSAESCGPDPEVCGPPGALEGTTLPPETGDVVSLPAAATSGGTGLRDTLARRRSVRAYLDDPLSLDDLSQLLWAAQGVTAAGGFRTAPSAGGLYPFELYAVVRQVDGLSPGLYHYRIGDHELGLVRQGSLSADLQAIAVDQEWVGQAAVTLVLVGVVPRTSVKYGSRALRFVFVEGGAIVQSVLLQAVDLGLGAVCVGGLIEEQLQAFVGTDAMPVAIVAVGPLPP